VLEQLIKREADVLGDLTEQDWRDVSTLMKRNPEKCSKMPQNPQRPVHALLAGFSLTRFSEQHNTLLCSLGFIHCCIGIFEKNITREARG
jgi:hypothetical protein